MLIRGWHAAPNLIWTHYDDSDDWIVFDPRSGDVHLVSASAHVLWQMIEASPALSVDQLVMALASKFEPSVDVDLAAVTRDTLEFMDRAGLITPDVQ